MVRLQTLLIVQGFGAKLVGGGTIKEQDLWRLNSDVENDTADIPSWAATSIEMRNKILEGLKK